MTTLEKYYILQEYFRPGAKRASGKNRGELKLEVFETETQWGTLHYSFAIGFVEPLFDLEENGDSGPAERYRNGGLAAILDLNCVFEAGSFDEAIGDMFESLCNHDKEFLENFVTNA